MKKTSLYLIMLLTLIPAFSCNHDLDPGVCYTTAEFNRDWVEANTSYEANVYVQVICHDWVRLLLQNCVEINGLALYPNEFEVSSYCRDITSASGEDHEEIAFRINHSCNFIDNPSYECHGYSIPVANVMLPEISEQAATELRLNLQSKETLRTTMDKVTVFYGDIPIQKFSEY